MPGGGGRRPDPASKVRFLDYEIELGLVMKRPISWSVTVTDDNLPTYRRGGDRQRLFGSRMQIPQMQFYKGKSFRTFGPVGPYLCLFGPPTCTTCRTCNCALTVNDKVRQNDSTANLVYGPAETLTELSGVQDLHIGDLI